MREHILTSIGGAGLFTYSLLARLARHRDELSRAWRNTRVRVNLCDIDGDRLKEVVQFARRAFAESGWEDALTVAGTTRQEEAIEGASLVLLARPFYAAEEACVEPARRAGLTDINAGPASIGVARLAFPEIRRLAEAIHQRARAGCVLLNLVNPTDVLAHATQASTGVTVWGMCGAPDGLRQSLAGILEIDPRRITRLRSVGVNHFSYLTELHVDDGPAMQRLRDTCAARRADEPSPRLRAWLDFVATIGLPYLTLGHPEPWCLPYAPVYVWKNPETAALRSAITDQLASPRIDTVAIIRALGWLDDTGAAVMRLAAALWGDASYEEAWQAHHAGEIAALPAGGWIERTMTLHQGRLATADFAPLPPVVQVQVALLGLQRREMGEAILHDSPAQAIRALTINPFNATLDAARRYVEEIWASAAR